MIINGLRLDSGNGGCKRQLVNKSGTTKDRKGTRRFSFVNLRAFVV